MAPRSVYIVVFVRLLHGSFSVQCFSCVWLILTVSGSLGSAYDISGGGLTLEIKRWCSGRAYVHIGSSVLFISDCVVVDYCMSGMGEVIWFTSAWRC